MMLPRSQFSKSDFARAIGCAVLAAPLLSLSVAAGTAKLDKETCAQFKNEQVKFIQSGILADLQRGPAWGKSNLSADRLREIEHFIMLDEQIKFACREATLTPNLLQVEEVAKRLEMNPNIDPFAPLPDGEAAPAQKSNAAAGAAAAQPNLMKPKSKALQQIEGTEPAKAKPAAQAKPKQKPQAKKPPVDDAYTGPPIVVDSGAQPTSP